MGVGDSWGAPKYVKYPCLFAGFQLCIGSSNLFLSGIDIWFREGRPLHANWPLFPSSSRLRDNLLPRTKARMGRVARVLG